MTPPVSKPAVIIGGGGHAKVVVLALLSTDARILGIADPALDPSAQGPFDLPVLGGDDEVFAMNRADIFLVNGIGGKRRRAVYERFSQQGFVFRHVWHPSAIVAEMTTLGAGVQILTGAVVHPGASLGTNALVNTRAIVEHDCVVGSHVHVAPGAILCGGARIGNGSHIGAGAVVIEGIDVGVSCVIGAGAVVTRDVPDGQTVGGVPAKPLGRRESAETR